MRDLQIRRFCAIIFPENLVYPLLPGYKISPPGGISERRTLVEKKKWSRLYAVIKWAVKACYPKIEAVGQENLPQEPAIIVGNHSQMHGPIACELYTPGNHYIWCAGEMMHLKDVPAYAYKDFWSKKPKAVRWFYKLASYVIAPLSVCVFNNANTIGVYHDSRILSTFKQTVQRLQEGNLVVVFPEHSQPYNNILCQFQDRFIDVAKQYYKRPGTAVCFVPMYLAPKLKKMYFGKPIRFCPDTPFEQARQRIAQYLMEQITDIAVSLPEHTVVPYNNVSKKEYKTNIPKEDAYEKTRG